MFWLVRRGEHQYRSGCDQDVMLGYVLKRQDGWVAEVTEGRLSNGQIKDVYASWREARRAIEGVFSRERKSVMPLC
jgi:hypothetical protein